MKEARGNQGSTGSSNTDPVVLSELGEKMLRDIEDGNFGAETRTAPSDEEGSDSQSTTPEVTEEPAGDTVSEEESQLPPELDSLRKQYESEVGRIMAEYQQLLQQMEQARVDYNNAVAWGTRKSQEASEAQRTIELLQQRIDALEKRLQEPTGQASSEDRGFVYDETQVAEHGLTPEALRNLLVQTPEYKQMVAALQQMSLREQQREYESQINKLSQQYLNKIENWSRELYGVPSYQLTDPNSKQLLVTAITLYGNGKVEEAEGLIRAELGRVILSRIESNRSKSNNPVLRAVSESARGTAPKGGRISEPDISQLDLGEDYSKLSAPEASVRRQEAMIKLLDSLPRK
ncbi:MAG: hypothetical protein QXO25_02250 [Candidatus Bathyarchaeia archaeon]